MWWKAPDQNLGMKSRSFCADLDQPLLVRNPKQAFPAFSDHQSRSSISGCNRSNLALSGRVSSKRHTHSSSREGQGNPKKAAQKVGKERSSHVTRPSTAVATRTTVDSLAPSETRKRGRDLEMDNTPIIGSSNSTPILSDHSLGRKRTKVLRVDSLDVGVNLTPDIPSTVPIATLGMHSGIPVSQDGPFEAPLL
ncbi:unnamed protein product [Calypogeia fissa]